MSKTTSKRNQAPRPYFRKYAVPDAPTRIATRYGDWVIRGATIVTAFALIFSSFVPLNVQADHGGPYGNEVMNKIVLCHWDGSNSYKSSGDISVNAVFNDNNEDSAHHSHSKDIIPPFHYKNGNDTASYPGKNWNTSNIDIWNSDGTKDGDCKGDGVVVTTGTLVVNKVITNDNGGTITTPATFSFQVNGGPTTAFEADGSNSITIEAGDYTVTESAATGYTSSYSAGCTGTIVAGQTSTCTITNNDNPPVSSMGTLIVQKVVVGSNESPASFSFQVDDGATTAFEADGQNNVSIAAGTYDVTEPAVANYNTTYSNCNDIIVPADGSATCVITNTYVSPRVSGTLVVNKVVSGGPKSAADFSYKINGGSSIPFEIDGSNQSTVAAGIYSVVEDADNAYTTTYSNCVNVEVSVDETETCTITNTFKTSVPDPDPANPTVHFIKAVCTSYSDVKANFNPAYLTRIGLNWQQLNPLPPFVNGATHPSEISANCTRQAGWQSKLSSDVDQTADVLVTPATTGTSANAEYSVPLASLPTNLKNAAINGQLWVSEVEKIGYQFVHLRCHNNGAYGDNLEEISLDGQTPSDVYCIAYNMNTDTRVHFIKALCTNYSDIKANFNPGYWTRIGDNWQQLDPTPPFINGQTDPGEISEDCDRMAGWQFKLSSDLAQTQDILITPATTGTADTAEYSVLLSDLPEALQNQAINGQLWVSEVEQPGYNFVHLRCHNNGAYGDNLEEISLDGGTPSDIYCIAYNMQQSGGSGDGDDDNDDRGGSRSGSRDNDDDEPERPGQVLGETTTIPSAPQVAGATLPRTGLPILAGILVALVATAKFAYDTKRSE